MSLNGPFLGASQAIVDTVTGVTGINVFNAAAFKQEVCPGFDAIQGVSYGNDGPNLGFNPSTLGFNG